MHRYGNLRLLFGYQWIISENRTLILVYSYKTYSSVDAGLHCIIFFLCHTISIVTGNFLICRQRIYIITKNDYCF